MFPPSVTIRPYFGLRTQLVLAFGLLVVLIGIVVLVGVVGSMQLLRGTRQSDANGNLSRVANDIAINTLLCRAHEKDILLQLDETGPRTDALNRWQDAATTLQQRIAEFEAIATTTEDRRQARLWRAQFNSYQQAFQELSQALAGPNTVTRSQADTILAPVQERLRTLTITAVTVAGDKATNTRQTAAEVVGDNQRYTQWLLLLGLVALLIASAWSLIFPGRLMRPIAALHSSAQSITQGDLKARTMVKRADELGVLAQTFNTMADTIERRTTDLESQFTIATAARAESEAAHAKMVAQLATIEAQRTTIRNMSVPVLPLSPNTVMMPLIGALDSERMYLAQVQALQALEQHAARYLILDVTGVPFIDHDVAQGMLGIIQSAQLLGTKVMLVGIRPEVAQVLIGLDIDLGNFLTRATLQEGIAATLYRQGHQVQAAKT
jgi:rsbT co-antagonist protein RsbR